GASSSRFGAVRSRARTPGAEPPSSGPPSRLPSLTTSSTHLPFRPGPTITKTARRSPGGPHEPAGSSRFREGGPAQGRPPLAPRGARALRGQARLLDLPLYRASDVRWALRGLH